MTGFIAAVSVFSASPGGAATWDAGGIDPHWSTPENWVGDVAPPNDGTADITFDGYPPATPVTQTPWSIRSLNLTGNIWTMALAGDGLTLGAGGLNATPVSSSTSTPTLIWNDLALSVDQRWQSTMNRIELIGDISTNGHHLTIDNSGEFVISGNVDFTGGLTKEGDGYLYFNSTPTATAGVSVRSGVLSIPSPIIGGARIDGGGIELRGDWDIGSLIAPGSIGGDLVWRGQSAIAFGGTNQLDVGSLGMAGPLRLGASVDSTIPVTSSIVPDGTTRTLRFGAGEAVLTMNSIVSDTPAGPTNLIFSGNGTTVLNASNTYTGDTTVSGGKVEANSPNTFGTDTAPTIVTGGDLQINSFTTEPFEVHGGTLTAMQDVGSAFEISGGTVSLRNVVNNPTFDNPITISGGTISYGVGSNSVGTVTGAINVQGGGKAVIRALTASSSTVVLDGPIQGDGAVVLDGTYGLMEVRTAMTHTRDTVIYSNASPNNFIGIGVSFESTQAFGGDLVIDGGVLRNNAPNTVPELILKGGRLEGTAPLTVTNPAVVLTSGQIEIPGGLIGLTEFTKTDPAEAHLLNLGTYINPTVTVQQGRLVVSNAAADVINGAVPVLNKTHAEIGITGYPPVMLDVQLNNATGVSYTGALTNWGTGFLGGTVDLGTEGAYIGGVMTGSTDRDYFSISGRITGGGLTKVGNVTLVLAGPDNDYTGRSTIDQGTLNVTGTGRLSATESILVRGNAKLLVDNAQVTTNRDHIADSVPIFMDNGAIEIVSPDGSKFTDPTFDETFGPLNLTGGAAAIITDRASGLNPAQSIEFAELNRGPTATVFFQTDQSLLGSAGSNQVRFTTAPALTNGILGGWAVVTNVNSRGVDFATYDAVLGVKPLPAAGRPTDVNSATATDNVLLAANTTLASDKSVYSLDMEKWVIDLNGRTLTIESGGLLMGTPSYAPEINNGRLTAGGDSSELILHLGTSNSSRGGRIRADIVDSVSGPTDLVVSRFWTTSRSYIELYGQNTYTGKTYVHTGAGIRIYEATAAPAGNDVVLNGGKYDLRPGVGNIALGDVTIRNGGELITYRSNALQADAIHAESGRIGANLLGNTPIIKTTTGTLTIGYANADNIETTNTNFSGDIDIQNGIVVVEPLRGLGSGTVTIRDGGRLVMDRPNSAQDSLAYGRVVMAGGEFAVGRRADVVLDGPFDVVADSRVLTFHGLAGTSYYTSNSRVLFDRKDVILSGPATLATGTTLSTLGEGSLFFVGDLRVEEGATVTGNVRVEPGPGRRVTGSGAIVGEVVISDGAALMPGVGTGRLTVDGGYTQLTGALLEIELAGGGGSPGLDFDQLRIMGQARIAGDLSVLLVNGFTPSAGDSYVFLNASAIVGGFDNVNLPALGSDLAWQLLPGGTSLTLKVVSTLVPGDLNGDGFVGIADLNILLPSWNTNVKPGELSSGDVNGDGFIGIEDLNTVLGNWNAGTPPAQASGTVPEPGALGILVLSGMSLLCRSNTRRH